MTTYWINFESFNEFQLPMKIVYTILTNSKFFTLFGVLEESLLQFMRILMPQFISNMKLYPLCTSQFNMCKIPGDSVYSICDLVREWKCIHVYRSRIELIVYKETGNRGSGYLILLIFGLQFIRVGFAYFKYSIFLRGSQKLSRHFALSSIINSFGWNEKILVHECFVHEFISWYMVC